jgi:hypothetical protein
VTTNELPCAELAGVDLPDGEGDDAKGSLEEKLVLFPAASAESGLSRGTMKHRQARARTPRLRGFFHVRSPVWRLK